jgi:predicted RNA-binding protein with RPS1 domain
VESLRQHQRIERKREKEGLSLYKKHSFKMASYVSGEEKHPEATSDDKKEKNTQKQVSDPKFRCRFYEKPMPEYEEIVMVQVNKIAEMGAYVSLLEYDDIEGMILLSELSRRRIRSINKLIRVGKSECVSVLRVDRDKGYIDLSKRRVSPEQLKETTERYNKGKVVHAIMRTVAEKLDLPLIDLNRMITWPLARSKMFPHPRDAFVMAIQDPDTIFEELKKVSKKYLGQLEERLKNLRKKQAAGEDEVLDAGHHRGGKDEEEDSEEEMTAEDMEASIACLNKGMI